MKRFWKPLLGLLAVCAAFTLTFAWPRQNGLNIDIDTSPRAQAARRKDPYDLTQLRVLNRVVMRVKDHYVEPERLNYRKMLLAGLDALQRNVAPMLVDVSESGTSVDVQVYGDRKSFAIDDVVGPWDLSEKFREIFAFVQDRLQDEPDLDLREVEYSAVNGMLHTLDPHTVLLTPDVFEDMETSTRGEFGGLGIVISLREGHLTVIKPMPGTPAMRAGLKRRDRIVKINDESTLNMPLSEAVNRLRGKPGSKVTVWITRKGTNGKWGSEKRVELTRAIIHIDSVEHRMLKQHIGYVKINNFQGNTHSDLRRALVDLRQKQMRGLLLDLRGNPGGLLDQAVRVTDTFIASGPIVTTSSQDPAQRDEKFAQAIGTEPDYPIVVLINGGSASASEIVAGALKNHNRALIVGQQSFGKGSVQVLYNFQEDGSALKLTVAQYLTPGDVSIQGVGIVPDIAITPMTVDDEDIDLEPDKAFIREEDLQQHLTHASASNGQRPTFTLQYYLSNETRQQLREGEPNEEENEEEETFLIRFGRKLLADAKATSRPDMLAEAKDTIATLQKEEMGHAVAELKRRGVDWSAGPDAGASKVEVRLSTNAKGNVAQAGEPFSLKARVTNKGDHPLYQLRATTKSDNRLFDGRELVFGKLEPGQTREWSTTLGICRTTDSKRTCALPRDLPTRADAIVAEFHELHDHAPQPAEIRTRIEELTRPRLGYSYQVSDLGDEADGSIQPGEHAVIYLTIHNVGEGTATKLEANIRNLGGRGVLLHDGRFVRDELKPNEEWTVPFTFEVLSDFGGAQARLELAASDTSLREGVSEKLTIPIASTQTLVERQDPTAVGLSPKTEIRSAPRNDAALVGWATDTPRVEQTGTANGFSRVDLGGGRIGWVNTASLTKPGRGTIRYAYDRMPPELKVDFDNEYVTRKTKLVLKGEATDDNAVRDVYMFSGARKIYYASNQGKQSGGRMRFEATIPLHGGINYITVVARENDDSLTRRLLVVRRDAEDGSLLETPKFDDDWFGLDAEF